MIKTFAFVLTLVLAGPAISHPAQTVKVKEDKPGLLKQARVTVANAERTALARVPHGRIVAAEIERENGKLIYSFDIKVSGKKGIEEVNIDAVKGTFVSQEHEKE